MLFKIQISCLHLQIRKSESWVPVEGGIFFLKKLPDDIYEHKHLKTIGIEKLRAIFQELMGYHLEDKEGKAYDIGPRMELKPQGGRFWYN